MIGLFDWAIWGLYLITLLIVIWFVRVKMPKIESRLFLIGFLVKVFGGAAFTAIYVFYYNGIGDTFLYSRGASVLADVFLNAPLDYFKLLAAPAGNIPTGLSQYSSQIFYSATSEEWFMVKLLSPIMLISFKSYLVATLLLSTIAFYGAWKLFLVFKDALPSNIYLAFIAAFLIPSTVFWGGGIIKDSLTMVGINVVIFALYFGLRKQFSFKLFIVSLVWAYIILGLKAYILLAFLPSFFLIGYRFVLQQTNNKVVQFFLTPLLVMLIAGVGYLSFQNLTSLSEKYNQENLKRQLVGFHTWHATIGESAYTLGEIEYTPIGIAKKVPLALATTFFMPFVWNASNPIILLSALESLFLAILFLMVSWKAKLFYFKFLGSRFFRSLIVFILVFGFVVGFTSYNFGALSRYKIPIMPLAVFVLLLINSQINALKYSQKN